MPGDMNNVNATEDTAAQFDRIASELQKGFSYAEAARVSSDETTKNRNLAYSWRALKAAEKLFLELRGLPSMSMQELQKTLDTLKRRIFAIENGRITKSSVPIANVEQKIRSEIYRAFTALGADHKLLATVGSWGDPLDDEEVFELLKQWNEGRMASED
jgi:hypothetical protein